MANTNTGTYDITNLQDFQRVLGILKRRYGTVNKKVACYFDGCTGWFEQLPPSTSNEYKTLIEQIKTYV